MESLWPRSIMYTMKKIFIPHVGTVSKNLHWFWSKILIICFCVWVFSSFFFFLFLKWKEVLSVSRKSVVQSSDECHSTSNEPFQICVCFVYFLLFTRTFPIVRFGTLFLFSVFWACACVVFFKSQTIILKVQTDLS